MYLILVYASLLETKECKGVTGSRSSVSVEELGGILPDTLGGGVRPPSRNPYLFQIKICDFPYPFSDLTKRSMSSFRPAL